MNAEQAWHKILELLQGIMTQFCFQQWVQPTRVIKYKKGVFRIGVPSIEAQDWLKDHLTDIVTLLLTGILNRSVEVQFVVEDTASEMPRSSEWQRQPHLPQKLVEKYEPKGMVIRMNGEAVFIIQQAQKRENDSPRQASQVLHHRKHLISRSR